jgi:hypothetical protein
MALVQCPECHKDVSSAAVSCPSCGHPILHVSNPPERTWSPGIAAVLSLVIPGAGQMYKGKVGSGLAWLLFVIIGYAFYIVPGIILHIFCIVSAASSR